jgi:hypothetical protein
MIRTAAEAIAIGLFIATLLLWVAILQVLS